MPQNLTDSSTFTTPVVAPTGGDVRNAASVVTALQALANRTKYLNDALILGATKAKSYADAAALRAETAHGNGSIAVLNGGSTGAVYIYDAASIRADDGALCIKPTDVGGGAGRWLHPAVKLLGASPSFTGTVGFADIACTGQVNAQGNVSTQGDLFASGDLTCTKVYATTLACSGAAQVGSLSCAAAATVNGSFHAKADATVDGELETGTLICVGAASVDGPAQFSDSITLASNGRIRYRAHVVSATTDLSFGVQSGGGVTVADTIYVPSGVIGAAKSYTFKSAGAANGSTIEICTDEASYAITLYQNDGATALSVGAIKNASGYARSVVLRYMNGGWRVVASDRVP